VALHSTLRSACRFDVMFVPGPRIPVAFTVYPSDFFSSVDGYADGYAVRGRSEEWLVRVLHTNQNTSFTGELI
jgi:hypothetical protein